MAKKATPTKEQLERRKIQESQGFHDCEKVAVLRGEFGNITGFGHVLKDDIKMIHDSNIQAFNEQQNNHGTFLRKKDQDYAVTKWFSKGREYPRGHKKEGQPLPYHSIVEDNGDLEDDLVVSRIPASGKPADDGPVSVNDADLGLTEEEVQAATGLAKKGREDLDQLAKDLGYEVPENLKTKLDVAKVIVYNSRESEDDDPQE